jgi:hypothetical protein
MISGSAGFRELRVGDRVQVYGIGRPNQTINADEVRLLGRDISPSDSRSVADDPNVITGVVRQVSTRENRLVVETDRREIQTVFGTATTPVYFGGGTYRISNIEVGDRVRVQVDSRTRDGVRARTIDVLQDATPEETRDGRTLTSIAGRVTRIDARVSTIRVNLGRGTDIRVDMLAAKDASGRNFRISDLQVGDRVEISGRYASDDTFRADTVRFASGGDGRFDRNEEVFGVPPRNDDDDDDDEDREVEDTEREFSTVVLYGTVQSPLGSGDALVVRENDNDLQIHVVDDFVVRLANGSYVTADQLRRGDRVVVQAFRDDDERLIAQTIRTR